MTITKRKSVFTVCVLISILLLSSCERYDVSDNTYTIKFKSLIVENPHLSKYQCISINGVYDFVDSTGKFEIGDDARKYSKNYKSK